MVKRERVPANWPSPSPRTRNVFPAPTLKISSNSPLAQNKPHWIDFDAGRMLTGDPDALAEDFMRLIVDVASGRAARNEVNEQREIAIWKDGVTL